MTIALCGAAHRKVLDLRRSWRTQRSWCDGRHNSALRRLVLRRYDFIFVVSPLTLKICEEDFTVTANLMHAGLDCIEPLRKVFDLRHQTVIFSLGNICHAFMRIRPRAFHLVFFTYFAMGGLESLRR